MSWAELDWPDLPPDFPVPRPATPPPPHPDVPVDIAGQVRRAERTRGIVVPLCALAGAGLVCAAAVVSRSAAPGRATLALALILAGLLAGFVFPALLVLLVIGPSWAERRQHLALRLWQRDLRRWREAERARYLATLSPAERQQLLHALDHATSPR